jgi:hypothetical protein
VGVFQRERTYFHHYDFVGFDNLNKYLFLKTKTMHIPMFVAHGTMVVIMFTE